jgi:hypothetical protein
MRIRSSQVSLDIRQALSSSPEGRPQRLLLTPQALVSGCLAGSRHNFSPEIVLISEISGSHVGESGGKLPAALSIDEPASQA